MSTVVGPVVVREGGYAFDVWTPERGLARGYRYLRVEDAYYARRAEIGLFIRPNTAVTCETLDEFDAVLAQRRPPSLPLPLPQEARSFAVGDLAFELV